MPTNADPTPVTEAPVEKGKPNIKYWVSQLLAAERAAEPSKNATQKAWREYLRELPKGKAGDKDMTVVKARYPIYWSSVKTIQPAIYARTPVPTVDKVFDDLSDDIARVASLCLERLAKYLMRHTPFDRIMYATRDEYIHGGKTTPRVCFDSDIRVEPVCVRYHEQQVPDPVTGQVTVAYYDGAGQPAPDGTELLQDEIGYYAETTNENVDRVGIELVPVHYADILHTPSARHHEEIDWIAYKSLLTRGDVEDRFGKETADKLAGYYKSSSDRDDDDRDKDTLPSLYATIWEIWDKRRCEVYWYCLGYNDEFIDQKEDIYSLSGFFPSPPFMLGTVGPDSLYPTPDYIQLEPLIQQIHGIAERIRKLVLLTQRKGIYDSSVKGLEALAQNAVEGEFIGVGEFQRLISEKGGLSNVIQFFPVEQLVSATQEMAQLMDLWEQKFSEVYGIPDILRGTSDPNETAAAQQLKGKYNSHRFSAITREFQRLCRDAIELMCDLALKKFPAQKLASIMGVPLMKPEEQAAWPQVLQLLQDDTERKVRVDIETDSTITMNENADIEQRNYLAKTMFEGLASTSQAMQQNPSFAAVSAQVLLYVTQGLRKGKEIEGSLKQLADQLTQQASQPPPEKPDPAMIKAQAAMQALQAKTQADIQSTQMKTQAEIQADTAKAQNSMAVEQGQLQHDAQIMQLRIQMEQMQAEFRQQIELLKTASKIKTDQTAERNKLAAKVAEHAFQTPPPGSEQVHVHLAPTEVKL